MIVEESKKERKARRKLEKQQLRSKPEAAQPRVEPKTADVPRRLAKWWGPLARTLDSDRSLTATKSSFLIAINCLMLSATAHSASSNPHGGALGLALVPLALTNLLSLAFAVLSAQVRDEPTALDAVLRMSDDAYEPALAHLLQDREQLFHTLGSGLHLHGSALVKSRRHLRTAYHVLLGGVALTAVTFALCFAFGAVPKAEQPAAAGGSE